MCPYSLARTISLWFFFFFFLASSVHLSANKADLLSAEKTCGHFEGAQFVLKKRGSGYEKPPAAAAINNTAITSLRPSERIHSAVFLSGAGLWAFGVNEAFRRFTAEGDLRSRLERTVAVCDGTKAKCLCPQVYTAKFGYLKMQELMQCNTAVIQ